MLLQLLVTGTGGRLKGPTCDACPWGELSKGSILSGQQAGVPRDELFEGLYLMAYRAQCLVGGRDIKRA